MNIDYPKTDKYISGLDKVYRRFLSKYKNISLLEIGIHRGGSMLMYENMLPGSIICGFDILPRPESLQNSKVITRIIDQIDTKSIESFADEFGSFDVIIDDGCHFVAETKNCFDTLWKYVKSGGLYIIEDWTVAYCAYEKKDKFSNYIGMDNLIFDIALQKIELGINSIEIVFINKPSLSYAAYGK